MNDQERFERLSKIYRRIFGGVFAVLLLWLTISLVFSVGSQVLEQVLRTRRLPKAPKIQLDSRAKANDCYKRLRGFYKEFLKHALDIHSKIKKNPRLAYEQWDQWYRDWQQTLSEFGDHYGFHTDLENPTEYYLRLKHKYIMLEDVAQRFDKRVRAMMDLLRSDFPALKREFSR